MHALFPYALSWPASPRGSPSQRVRWITYPTVSIGGIPFDDSRVVFVGTDDVFRLVLLALGIHSAHHALCVHVLRTFFAGGFAVQVRPRALGRVGHVHVRRRPIRRRTRLEVALLLPQSRDRASVRGGHASCFARVLGLRRFRGSSEAPQACHGSRSVLGSRRSSPASRSLRSRCRQVRARTSTHASKWPSTWSSTEQS